MTISIPSAKQHTPQHIYNTGVEIHHLTRSIIYTKKFMHCITRYIIVVNFNVHSWGQCEHFQCKLFWGGEFIMWLLVSHLLLPLLTFSLAKCHVVLDLVQIITLPVRLHVISQHCTIQAQSTLKLPLEVDTCKASRNIINPHWNYLWKWIACLNPYSNWIAVDANSVWMQLMRINLHYLHSVNGPLHYVEYLIKSSEWLM